MNPFVTQRLTLNLDAGMSLLFDIEVLDDQEVPVDLTGCTVEMVLTQGTTVRLNLSTPDMTNQLTISNAIGGIISVNILPATSVNWLGTFELRVNLIGTTGIKSRLLEGVFHYTT